jgi:hypothetical protein
MATGLGSFMSSGRLQKRAHVVWNMYTEHRLNACCKCKCGTGCQWTRIFPVLRAPAEQRINVGQRKDNGGQVGCLLQLLLHHRRPRALGLSCPLGACRSLDKCGLEKEQLRAGLVIAAGCCCVADGHWPRVFHVLRAPAEHRTFAALRMAK